LHAAAPGRAKPCGVTSWLGYRGILGGKDLKIFMISDNVMLGRARSSSLSIRCSCSSATRTTPPGGSAASLPTVLALRACQTSETSAGVPHDCGQRSGPWVSPARDPDLVPPHGGRGATVAACHPAATVVGCGEESRLKRERSIAPVPFFMFSTHARARAHNAPPATTRWASGAQQAFKSNQFG